MTPVEQITMQLEDARARLRDAEARLEQAVNDDAADSKRAALWKTVDATKRELQELGIKLHGAQKREAEEKRRHDVQEVQQRLEAAAKTLPPLDAAFTAVQRSVENLGACYTALAALTADARRALHAAGIKDRALLDALSPSLDLLVANEMARAGIGFLAHVRLTGVSDSFKIPEVMGRRIEKVRGVIGSRLAELAPKATAA